MLLALLLAFSLTTPDLTRDLAWRNIGPAITGGRIDDIAVDESHPDTIYVGAATGGVWKTINGGTTWTPIFDDFGTTSIGDIAIARSNPKIIWVGTGEANNRQSSSWGNGIYRSTDAGARWQLMGLPDSRHIGRIVIHPTNPDIVYVAALGHLFGPNRERGLFKTTDGGKTWTNTKFIDENTGFVDVAMDPRDPDTLYAAAYQRERKAYGFNGGGPGSGLYKTTNGGKTWTRLAGGLPEGNVGRIGIDIYRKNPSIVYVTFEHKNGGVFRSDDRGKTWTKTTSLNPRPLYFSQIRIDPQDDRRIYLLGTSLYVSDDGGKTFRSDGARNVHVDHHAMSIDPEHPATLWLGNDGGVWFSRDRSVTWTRVNNMPLAQIYGVSFDMRDPYYVYAGLQDNGVWSGPSATRTRVGPLNDDWIQVGGGDGMMVTAATNDPSTAYVEMQDGRLMRFDYTTGESAAIKPFERSKPAQSGAPAGSGPQTSRPQATSTEASGAQAGGGRGRPADSLRFNWTTPIVVSPHNPLTLYIAGDRLWRSLDRGDHWTAISPDLSRHIDRNTLPIMGVKPSDEMLGRNDGITAYGTATTMAESPTQPGLLIVGTDDGLVQISKNGGAAWDNVTARIPGAPEGAWVNADLSPADADRMYVAFDNHRSDDYRPYLYVSDDGGATWRAQTTGLPADAPVRVVREDPFNPKLVFAGTERGVFMSMTGGSEWRPLKNQLPDVPVFDIKVQPRDRDLVIATHGRGIYIMNIAPLEAWSDTVAAAKVHPFTPQPAVTFNVLEHRDFLGQAVYVGGNPPRGAVIDYTLADDAKQATLRIANSQGDLVRELTVPGQAGLHRAEWDLRLAPPPQPHRQPPADGVIPGDPRPAESTHARIAGDFGGGGDPTGGEAGAAPEPLRGPMVPPGEYRVTVAANGTEAVAWLHVNADPRVQISEDDQAERWRVLKSAYDAQQDAIPLANRALDLRDQMAATAKALGGVKNVPEDLKKFVDESARTVREAQGRVARTTGAFGSVGREVSGSTTRPTAAQGEQLAAALEEMPAARTRVEEMAKKAAEVNQRLDAASMPASVPRVTVKP